MKKQELIKKYEDLFEKLYAFPIDTINGVIEDFKQLDEPQKVMIPRFIADWIVQAKEDGYNIAGAINEAPRGTVDDWLELENVDIFAEAWVNGYHIEKEKRYIVAVKNIDKDCKYLKWNVLQKYWYIGNGNNALDLRLHHTMENLQKGGFGDVFTNPLFEVEEVEE